jgi:hypothetical protein
MHGAGLRCQKQSRALPDESERSSVTRIDARLFIKQAGKLEPGLPRAPPMLVQSRCHYATSPRASLFLLRGGHLRQDARGYEPPCDTPDKVTRNTRQWGISRMLATEQSK